MKMNDGKVALGAAKVFLWLVPVTLVIYLIALVIDFRDTSKDPGMSFGPWVEFIIGCLCLSFGCGVIGLLQRIVAVLEERRIQEEARANEYRMSRD